MNANDYLKHYNCSDEYFQRLGNLLITEGVKAMADQFECYWFIDIVASYQAELKREEFQVWKLKSMEDKSAVIQCTDGNNRVLKVQVVPYTDFKPKEATV